MNKTKLYLIILISVFSMQVFAQSKKGSQNSSPQQQTPAAQPAPNPKSPTQVAYEEISSLIDESMRQIQSKTYQAASQNSQKAIKKLKEIGIDSQVGISINCDAVWADGYQFSEISFSDQSSISEKIKREKEGYFVDFLNLYKRAYVSFIKASYYEMKENNKTPRQSDLKYFRQWLIEAYAIPVFCKYSSNTRVFFDSDAVDEVRQFQYNSEIYDLVLEIPNLFDVNPKAVQANGVANATTASIEAAFEKGVEEFKKAVSEKTNGVKKPDEAQK